MLMFFILKHRCSSPVHLDTSLGVNLRHKYTAELLTDISDLEEYTP